jgi:hypothetical protein
VRFRRKPYEPKRLWRLRLLAKQPFIAMCPAYLVPWACKWETKSGGKRRLRDCRVNAACRNYCLETGSCPCKKLQTGKWYR